MTWAEFFQTLALASGILFVLCVLVLLYGLAIAAYLDYRDRKLKEKVDSKFFKLIEGFRRDFD